MTEDRTYIQVREGLAWHAFVTWTRVPGRFKTRCRTFTVLHPNEADRVPSAGHLCGTCARSIAAGTDVEAE